MDRPPGPRPWVVALGWCGVVLTAVPVLLRWLDVTGPVPAIQSGLPLVGLATVVLFLSALVVRARAVAAVTAALLAVHLALAGPWWWSRPADPAPTDTVVLAANLQFGQGSMPALTALVEERGVDALALVEATPETAEQLEGSRLAELLPHRSGQVRTDAGGTLVLTADPHTVVDGAPQGSFEQVAVRVQPGGSDHADWVFLAVHPAPPLVSTSTNWRTDLAELGRWVAASDPDLPLVLAGDFNSSQAHPAFREATAGLTHAHRQSGSGWVRTWPAEGALPPYVQLDHVLVRGMTVTGAGVEPVPGSDHHAVWASLRQ